MDRLVLETFVQLGYTQRRIADMQGVDPKTVRYWLAKYELQTVNVRRRERQRQLLLLGQKECARCSRVKDLDDFAKCSSRQPQTVDGRQAYCKQCITEYVAERRGTYATLQQQRMELLRIRAGGRCIECGYDKCKAALHFHHRDPLSKKFGLAKAAGNAQVTLVDLQAESDKCDLLCANCHSEKHAGAPRNK